ncbi:MAG: DUF6591 domain-containing protein [Candidatus Heteroscillospira sp.]|jgi:hypothetical protein
MKKVCSIFLACAISLLSGCSSASDDSGQLWTLEGAEPVYVSEWPENDYTALIPQPESGEMDYVLDISDAGRYAVVLKNISMENSEEYVESLKAQGFSELASERNQVSVGLMLKKDGTCLSVSYSDKILGILITVEN